MRWIREAESHRWCVVTVNVLYPAGCRTARHRRRIPHDCVRPLIKWKYIIDLLIYSVRLSLNKLCMIKIYKIKTRRLAPGKHYLLIIIINWLQADQHAIGIYEIITLLMVIQQGKLLRNEHFECLDCLFWCSLRSRCHRNLESFGVQLLGLFEWWMRLVVVLHQRCIMPPFFINASRCPCSVQTLIAWYEHFKQRLQPKTLYQCPYFVLSKMAA